MIRKISHLAIVGLCFLGATSSFAQDKNLSLFGDNKAKGPTIITATQEASFDSQNSVAIFTGDVQVQDPQFSMTCDRLTVQLDKDNGGIKQAEADGSVLIVSISKDKNGGPDTKSTGKADRAIYTPGNGQIALSGTPQIQQGGNLHIATEAGTRMLLFRDGRLKTVGGSRTIIQPVAKENQAPR